jgi:hypothetical protein
MRRASPARATCPNNCGTTVCSSLTGSPGPPDATEGAASRIWASLAASYLNASGAPNEVLTDDE